MSMSLSDMALIPDVLAAVRGSRSIWASLGLPFPLAGVSETLFLSYHLGYDSKQQVESALSIRQ